MAVDKRIELEIALRDTVSVTLKAIADNLENINKALAKGGQGKGEEGAEAFRKIKESTEGIRKISEEGARTTTAAAESMLPIAAQLLRGAVGKFVVYEEIARFAANFVQGSARERQEWESLAEDTGLRAEFVSMLVNAQRQVGIDPGQAKANISNVMNSIQDAAAGRGGQLTQRLSKIGEGAFAHDIEDLAMAGKREEAVRAILERGEQRFKVSETEGLKFAAAVGVPPSMLKGMSTELKTAVPNFMMSIKAANNWAIGWNYTATWLKSKYDALGDVAVKGGNRATTLLGTFFDYLRTSESKGYGPLSPYLIPDDKLEAFKERNKETLSILQDIFGIFQRQQNKQSLEKRWVGGPVLPGRRYLVGENGPETFRSNAGWGAMLEGPEIISPDTGGTIDPSPWDQADRFGAWRERPSGGVESNEGGPQADWNNWRYNAEGILTPRPQLPPGLTPEQNWEHFNRALKGPWGWAVGESEGQTSPGHDADPEKPSVWDLQQGQAEMEGRSSGWLGGFEDLGFERPKYQQPIGFRRSIDSELGGGGGSLGAEIIFRNVPEGVDTSAEGDGFDNFTVNKTRQLHGA